MSTFIPRVGYALVKQDPDENKQGLIFFSERMHRKKASGICLIHNASDWWEAFEDVPLEGLRIYFEKWAWKDIVLDGHDLLLIPERAIIAYETSTEETDMNRKELLEELNAKVKEIVEDEVPDADADITDEQAENIDALLQDDIATQIVEDEVEDDEPETESELPKEEA